MKRRPRPIADTIDQPMFERVDVDVIDAPFEVWFIPARVFKKPPLPHALFAAFDTTGRESRAGASRSTPLFCKTVFNPPPTGGILGVALGKFPKRCADDPVAGRLR